MSQNSSIEKRKYLTITMTVVLFLVIYREYSKSVLTKTKKSYTEKSLSRVLDEKISEAFVQKPKRVLLLTTFRSGSTFAGQLFNQNFDAFYLFEPLGIVFQKC